MPCQSSRRPGDEFWQKILHAFTRGQSELWPADFRHSTNTPLQNTKKQQNFGPHKKWICRFLDFFRAKTLWWRMTSLKTLQKIRCFREITGFCQKTLVQPCPIEIGFWFRSDLTFHQIGSQNRWETDPKRYAIAIGLQVRSDLGLCQIGSWSLSDRDRIRRVKNSYKDLSIRRRAILRSWTFWISLSASQLFFY